MIRLHEKYHAAKNPGSCATIDRQSHSTREILFTYTIFFRPRVLFCKDRSQSEVDQDDHTEDDAVISEELEVMLLDISK